MRLELNRHVAIGVHSGNLIGASHCLLELVREAKVLLLVDHISNSVVVSNALGVLTHEAFVNEELSVVVD